MTLSYNYYKQSVILFLMFGLLNIIYSQNNPLLETKILDSLLANGEIIKADSVLSKNITELKQHQHYTELTRRIYYYGKIQLQLKTKDDAIKSVLQFADGITQLTDSIEVSRQKHLTLSRFYAFLRDYKSASEQNLLALAETEKMPNATADMLAIIHHNLSVDYRRMGNVQKAIWHSRKSIDLYLSYPKSDPTKVLDAYNSLGARMWDAYKIDSALYYFKKGEKIIDKLENNPMNQYYHRAKTQSNIASVSRILGNNDQAQLYNEKAIKNYNLFINSEGESKDFFKEEARLFLLLTIENYADDFSNEGNYIKARDLIEYVHNQKLKYFPNDELEIGYTCLNLGNIYLNLKDYKKAESLFSEGLKIYSNSEQPNQLSLADGNYYNGVINEFYGNVNIAEDYYEKSKAYYENIYGENYDEFFLNAMLTYSNFYSKNGYSEKAIEIAEEAYNYVLKNQGKQTELEVKQLLNLAQIHYDANQLSKASDYVDKALAIIDKDNNALSAHTWSYKKPLAILLKTKIDLDNSATRDTSVLLKCFNDLKEALKILEDQKTNLTDKNNVSIIVDRNNDVFEFSKELAMELYNKSNDQSFLKEVLNLHESKLYNKIRQQLNISNFSSIDISNEIKAQEKKLLEDLNSALEQQNSLDIFIKAKNEWTQFLTNLEKEHPKYYNLKYAPISQSFEDYQVGFYNDKTIIRYVYIDKNLYAFLIENKSVKSYKINTAKLKSVLEKHLRNIESLEYDLSLNHQLYKILWQPFENDITNTGIIIVPDEDLFNLSFETLTSFDPKSLSELIEHSLLNSYSISYNFSLLLIDKNKSTRYFKDNFVGFTPEFNNTMKSNYKIAVKDSVFFDKTYLTLLPQPFTVDLAKEYSRVFSGDLFSNENASKSIFTNNAKEHKIIHIGTHAESNNISPELSRLIFAKSITNDSILDDNYLYTYEIYNQDLSSNLAILTACETGKPTFQPGEGMISLAHAFNYAGSESILTSLWKIDEQSSAEILKYFYNNLSDGLPKDEALRQAKLNYLASAKGRTLSPQYWAGLVLIGDTSPIDLQVNNNWWIWVLSILAIAVIIFFIFKNKKAKV